MGAKMEGKGRSGRLVRGWSAGWGGIAEIGGKGRGGVGGTAVVGEEIKF